MATAKIAAAIKSIPAKKADLRRAFEALQSTSSSLASFTLQWNDLEAHFSTIEKSIQDRFNELQAKDTEKSTISFVEDKPSSVPKLESTPRPELVSLCAKMDGKGLRTFITNNRKDSEDIWNELNPALRAASDPALLVLDAMAGFFPAKPVPHKDGVTNGIRRICVELLERVPVVADEIKPAVQERAKKLAAEWKGKISGSGGDNGMEVMGFSQLIISYGLVEEYKQEDLLDLLVLISRRKQAPELMKNLGLSERAPDLIQKLSNKGRQIDAVKIASAFNLFDKFPPVPLLKDYIKEARNTAVEMKKENNSMKTQNEASAKVRGALQSVLKAIKDYELESEYPISSVEQQIANSERQIEKRKSEKKRTAVPSNSGTPLNLPPHQQPNKRPRPAANAPVPDVPAQYRPTPVQSLYTGMAGTGSYGLSATGSLYNMVGSSLGGTHTSLFPSEPLAGTEGSYERRPAYNGYTLSGPPSSYRSSYYP